jgi:hypothetical protein
MVWPMLFNILTTGVPPALGTPWGTAGGKPRGYPPRYSLVYPWEPPAPGGTPRGIPRGVLPRIPAELLLGSSPRVTLWGVPLGKTILNSIARGTPKPFCYHFRCQCNKVHSAAR